MSYVNLNNPANFQLQEFEQLGFRYIVTGRPTISGETYRTIFVLADAVVTATCPNGDSLSSETLVAGTIIHGFFESVSVASGSLLAYKAGPITAQEIYDFYKAYVYANGGIIEGESCAVTEIAALLAEGLYSMASLVLIPSGYKVGTVYSERPTDSNGQLTFTRNSEATRVNSEGLVEKVRTNLWLQSTELGTFPNATTSAASITGGQSGYDGSTNAWELESLSDGFYRRLYQSGTQTGVITFSIYAKSANTNFLLIYNNQNGDAAWFDLSTGSLGNLSGAIDSSIEAVGATGWYRCSMSINTTASSQFWISPTNGNNVASCDLGNSILLQDAQLEEGLVATDYIPTTTAAVSVGPVSGLPRLDYSGGATCPSLLLEPSRTNNVTHSEYFGDSSWLKTDFGTGAGAPTITANAAISPEGLQNAYQIDFPETTGAEQSVLQYSYTSVAFTTYTHSIYLKADVASTLIFRNAAGAETVIEVTTEWKRFETTVAASSTTSNIKFGLRPANGSQTAACTIYAWGAQAEAGSYPTSYIPTLGSAVTRLADDCVKTSAASIIGQTEGVAFIDFDFTGNYSTGGIIPISIDGGSLSEIYFWVQTNGTARFDVYNSTQQVNISGSIGAVGRKKVAIAYKQNDFALYINGVQIGTDTSGTVPATNRLYVGRYYANVSYNMTSGVNQVLLFKTRLTNAQLAALTTL